MRDEGCCDSSMFALVPRSSLQVAKNWGLNARIESLVRKLGAEKSTRSSEWHPQRSDFVVGIDCGLTGAIWTDLVVGTDVAEAEV